MFSTSVLRYVGFKGLGKHVWFKILLEERLIVELAVRFAGIIRSEIFSNVLTNTIKINLAKDLFLEALRFAGRYVAQALRWGYALSWLRDEAYILHLEESYITNTNIQV